MSESEWAHYTFPERLCKDLSGHIQRKLQSLSERLEGADALVEFPCLALQALIAELRAPNPRSTVYTTSTP